MTRINVIPPSELHNKHLIAEIKEITRVFGYVRKLKDRKINKFNFYSKMKQPSAYTLGTGHVLFFYTRLGWVVKRYKALCDEWRSRGYNVNEISSNELLEGIDSFYIGDWNVTEEASRINIQRINERLADMKNKRVKKQAPIQQSVSTDSLLDVRAEEAFKEWLEDRNGNS